jgi:hypothetical protein
MKRHRRSSRSRRAIAAQNRCRSSGPASGGRPGDHKGARHCRRLQALRRWSNDEEDLESLSPEAQQRAVRTVLEHGGDHGSQTRRGSVRSSSGALPSEVRDLAARLRANSNAVGSSVTLSQRKLRGPVRLAGLDRTVRLCIRHRCAEKWGSRPRLTGLKRIASGCPGKFRQIPHDLALRGDSPAVDACNSQKSELLQCSPGPSPAALLAAFPSKAWFGDTLGKREIQPLHLGDCIEHERVRAKPRIADRIQRRIDHWCAPQQSHRQL